MFPPNNLHLCPHPSVLFIHSMATRGRPNTDSLALVSRGGHLDVSWHRCDTWSRSTCPFALPRRWNRLPPYRPARVYQGGERLLSPPPSTTNELDRLSDDTMSPDSSNTAEGSSESKRYHRSEKGKDVQKTGKLCHTYLIPMAHSRCSHRYGYAKLPKRSFQSRMRTPRL